MRYVTPILLFALLFTACGPTEASRKEYVEKHDPPYHIEQAILNGNIGTGMTKEEVRASWGKPNHINESYYEGVGSRTQWCYGQYSSECVYFEEGVVTGWN